MTMTFEVLLDGNNQPMLKYVVSQDETTTLENKITQQIIDMLSSKNFTLLDYSGKTGLFYQIFKVGGATPTP